MPIYYKDGRAAVAGRLDEVGNATLIFLERERTQRFANKTGYRWYSQYRLPAEYGGGQITLRHLGNKEDVAKRFNRIENFRVIPHGDPDFDRLYARRGDAASINGLLDDTLYSKIVFGRVTVNGRHENQNIYTVNADGSGLFQVTYNGVYDFAPDCGTQPLAT